VACEARNEVSGVIDSRLLSENYRENAAKAAFSRQCSNHLCWFNYSCLSSRRRSL